METDHFNADTAAFLSWLTSVGVTMSPKMALMDLRSHGRGRGVVAIDDFDEDEVVFSIPRSSVLNVANWRQKNPQISGSHESAVLAELPNWLALTLVMMIEAQKSNSEFSPYFSVLPKHLDTLTFWSATELQELQASAVVDKIGKAAAEAAFHQQAVKLGLDGADVNVFHRIASIIMAYAFDIPEESEESSRADGDDEFVEDDEDTMPISLSMIPLADMLNADAERNNARLCCDNEDLEMRAVKPIKKGEEILNDYGLLPRSALLRRYGYITNEYVPYDVTEISTESVISALKDGALKDADGNSIERSPSVLEQRVELARREDILDDTFDVGYADPELPGIPDELVALIYLLLADDHTVSKIERSSFPSRSRMCTASVGAVLVQLLQRRAAEYATTLEEDELLLRTGGHGLRATMAIEVRLGEKKVLRSAAEEARSLAAQGRETRGGDADERATKRARHS